MYNVIYVYARSYLYIDRVCIKKYFTYIVNNKDKVLKMFSKCKVRKKIPSYIDKIRYSKSNYNSKSNSKSNIYSNIYSKSNK